MKKVLSLVLIILVIFTLVCVVLHTKDTSNSEDAFAFELPNGFTISDISDKECSIIDEAGLCIGGFTITEMKKKDIKDSDGVSLAQYLNQIHEGSEYIAWNGADPKKPVKYVNESVPIKNSGEHKEFYHVFFERNSLVYDMWFDTDMIDSDMIEKFATCVVEQ